MIRENGVSSTIPGVTSTKVETPKNVAFLDVYSGNVQGYEQAYSGNIHSFEKAKAAPKKGISQEEKIYFYTCQDSSKLSITDLKKVRALQDENDRLQKQINRLSRDVIESDESLDLRGDKEILKGERERLIFLMARNTGEILKIYVENQERLDRISQLKAENSKLYAELVAYKEAYTNANNDLTLRSQTAAEFFLVESKLKRNQTELAELSYE